MSAPFPSLTEQARIATHGMFDTEILAAMEEHADDTVPCDGCDKPATGRAVCRYCRHLSFTLCIDCTTYLREFARWKPSACDGCGRIRTGWSNLVKVVPL